MERVWGGRELQHHYQRVLPEGCGPIGEAWELVDRVDHQSVVNHGPLTGTTLHELWTRQRREIFGDCPDSERFPVLIKILDCREDLSLQVHPPQGIAAELGGDPKNEVWYIAHQDEGARLHIGLREGVTRKVFTQALEQANLDACLHSIEASRGQSIYIPSGRLHAIGGGFLIHEIQQNSDTTYRVHDWNRMGLDGQPRELHIEESMKCIDFEDVEPGMTTGACDHDCGEFRIREHELGPGEGIGNPQPGRFSLITLTEGLLRSGEGRAFTLGDTLLLPQESPLLTAATPVKLIQTTLVSG